MAASGEIRKILVIKLRNIGDVLLSSALFWNLKELFPGAQISALVNSGTREMLDGNPAVDRVFTYDRGIKKAPLVKRVAGEFSFYRRLRKERFDVVLNLTEGDRGALVALFSGAWLRVGLDPQNTGLAGKRRFYTHLIRRVPGAMHSVEQNLLFLEPLGAKPVGKRVSFFFGRADSDRVAELLLTESLAAGRYFHAHMTSRWMFKALPHDRAAFLLDRLSELSGLPAVLTCAPEKKELDYLAALRPLLRRPFHDLGGRVTLKELGALSAGARFFVGVDSAPMHIAAALDVPVLGLYGPSHAREWGPWNNEATEPYRARNGLQRSGKHLVLQDDRDCVPCNRDGCNGSKVSDCLAFPDAVLRSCAAQFWESVEGA